MSAVLSPVNCTNASLKVSLTPAGLTWRVKLRMGTFWAPANTVAGARLATLVVDRFAELARTAGMIARERPATSRADLSRRFGKEAGVGGAWACGAFMAAG